MTRLRPLEHQILNSGEPRHYVGGNFIGVPKIDRSGHIHNAESLHQRQKIFAPRYRTRGLTQILNALRFR